MDMSNAKKHSAAPLAVKLEFRQREARFGFNTLGEVIPATHQGSQRNVTLIAAMDLCGGIGMNGDIPWTLPPDMRQFRRLTLGHPVIMGRKTHASLPFNSKEGVKMLPGRMNIVISRNSNYVADHVHPQVVVVKSLEDALAFCGEEQMFVIGGGEIYKQALGYANDLILTKIENIYTADAKFPALDLSAFMTPLVSSHEHAGLEYTFSYLLRKQHERASKEGVKYERFVSIR